MKRLGQIARSEKERQAVNAAAVALRARLPVREIILFGSKARGDHHPESDVNLLVLTERALTRREQRLVIDLLFPLQREYGVLFSTLEVPIDE